MQRNKAIKNIFYIAILSTFVVLSWIGSSLYYGLVTSTVPSDTSKYTTPITPDFDTETLTTLINRTSVPIDLSGKGNYIDNSSSSATLPVVPSDTPPPVQVTASPSAQTQTASQGASINQPL